MNLFLLFILVLFCCIIGKDCLKIKIIIKNIGIFIPDKPVLEAKILKKLN